ncbi:MAG: GlxA family transcriptional regulator [Gammaproteobacteria bacterium]
MPNQPSQQATTRYGFLLIPEYSMMAFTAAIDQLRMANRLSGKQLYEWIILSDEGEPVTASNDLTLTTIALKDAGRLDAVFVCGGINIEQKVRKSRSSWLRDQAARKVAIGALCTGTYLLAEAGLLQKYRCTIHWENMVGLRERFPELVISPDLFEIDNDRYTCAGGSAAMDMMVYLIAQKHGWDLATEIAEEFLVERIRGRNDRQRLPLRLQLGASQPKLAEAVAFMEANIEELISLDEIASHVGLSRRQLERLFQKYLHCVPTRYYMRLRLMHARQLLLQTSMPIVDIAYASGFVSTPHFSKCYREFFGIPPREERRAHKQVEIAG